MRTGELYQRYYGLYVGKIVAVDDPQGLGRVRVQCDQYVDSIDDPLWAIVARPGGGKTSVFFTPDVGDQVIFAFQVGDVNGPVVLGYAHNSSGDQKVPEQVKANPKQHGVVTSIGSVVFDEGAKKIVVTFNGSTSSTITMDDEGVKITSDKIRLDSKEVLIGDDNTAQPIPLGNTLRDWLRDHTHPTAMGPSGMVITVPTVPDVNMILSQKHKLDS